MAETERQEALATALKKIEKNFGKGAIMRMGDESGDTRFCCFQRITCN